MGKRIRPDRDPATSQHAARAYLLERWSEERLARFLMLAKFSRWFQGVAAQFAYGIEWLVEARRTARRVPRPPAVLSGLSGAAPDHELLRTVLALADHAQAVRDDVQKLQSLEMTAEAALLRMMRRMTRWKVTEMAAVLVLAYALALGEEEPRAKELMALSIAAELESPPDDPDVCFNTWTKRRRKVAAEVKRLMTMITKESQERLVATANLVSKVEDADQLFGSEMMKAVLAGAQRG